MAAVNHAFPVLAIGAALLLCACGTAPSSVPASSSRPSSSAALASASGSAAVAASASHATAPVIHGTLTVFAAASLTDAFNQMKSAIQAGNPGTTVNVNYAGSQVLRTQLSQGAKADVFASADTANMDGSSSDGTIEGKASIFAHNKLAVVVPASNAKVGALQDLAKPGIKIIIEQASVPAGNYSRQALTNMSADPAYGSDFASKVMANVVSQETDVKAVLSRVQLGEADAGMLYVSDIATAQAGTVKSIPIPDQFNLIADYPIAVVKGAPNPDGAQAFISYVLAPSGGQAILERSGLLPVTS